MYPESALRWVCAAAASNHSPMNCTHCDQTNPLPDIAPLHPISRLPPPASSPSLAWFTSVTKPEEGLSVDNRAYRLALSLRTLDSLRVALLSARLHAPSLAPYVVYLHTEEQPLAHDAFSRDAQRLGARVLLHRLTFASRLTGRRKTRPVPGLKHINYGTWARMDLAQLLPALAGEMAARRLHPHVVLYTNADVIFQADVRRPAAPLPTFAAGSEGFSASLNSGVMFMNLSTFQAEWGGMLAHAVRKDFRFSMAEQAWLQEWFDPERRMSGGGRRRAARVANRSSHRGWLSLDDEAFNARAWRHAAARRARIWHWHGYKPADVRCWLDAMVSGAWPRRAWRDLDGCDGRGRCRYRPVKDSGCRWFSRIELAPCYLHTYVHLLLQHERFLWLANHLCNASADP
ncbi:hypothetical protein AB1Y20_013389 [Prymnesium parvum]|uniref:Protein xylosyltransferase n=1 Tax=Prymnesium parvum TaxID=97485 RepID=A0AB34IGA5_PRYPA